MVIPNDLLLTGGVIDALISPAFGSWVLSYGSVHRAKRSGVGAGACHLTPLERVS